MGSRSRGQTGLIQSPWRSTHKCTKFSEAEVGETSSEEDQQGLSRCGKDFGLLPKGNGSHWMAFGRAPVRQN